MSNRRWTTVQIKELLANKNVDNCSDRSITYNKEFKAWAVKRYYKEGYSPRMIFEEAGFDLVIIGKERVKCSLLRWRRTYSKKGKNELIKENRGGPGRRKKLKFKSKNEEIEYLKTKIAYMDAENDFLAKLRGLKRE